MTEEA